MKNLFIIFLLPLFFSLNMNARSTDSLNSNRFIIKIVPTQAIVGEFQMQFEKMNGRHGMELMLSYIAKSTVNVWYANAPKCGGANISNTYLRNGFKIGTGYRVYCKNATQQKGMYWSPMLTYKYVYYSFTNPDYFGNALGIRFTDATYHIATFMWRYGTFVSIKNIFFDFYCGIGMKYKYGIANTESTRPEVVITQKRELESWLYPNINLGITVGYQFKHKEK